MQGTDECWWSLMVVKPRTIPATYSIRRMSDTHEHFFDDNRIEKAEKELTAMECIDEYFRWMAEIWIQKKSRNLFRIEELKAKYLDTEKAYKLYQRVCTKHRVTPRPQLRPTVVITPKGVIEHVEEGEKAIDEDMRKGRGSLRKKCNAVHFFL